MQLHQIKPIHRSKFRKRIGRGGKRGTYSGRGLKGQKSRAGHKIRPAIRDLIQQIPKVRGYKFKGFRQKPVVLNVKDLADFKSGSVITPEILWKSGLIDRIKGKLPAVKILGEGELKTKLSIKDCKVSLAAKEKIEKAAGTIQ